MYEYYNYDNDAAKAQQEELNRRYEQERNAQKKAKRKKWGVTIGTAIIFGLIAGGIFLGVSYGGKMLLNRFMPETRTTEEVAEVELPEPPKEPEQIQKTEIPKTNMSNPVSSGLSVSDVAEAAMPSIVAITNKSLQEVRMMFSYGTQVFESESQGSGIIVAQNDTELLILTNNHVVDGAETLTVQFIDDEALEAKVKGSDPDMDVAVIAVSLKDMKSSTKDAIKVAVMGDSDSLRIGEQVVAIGNALGYGQSVTTGIVSALNRSIEEVDNETGFIQTDAAINPGNSGGALLNMNGELVGINSAKLSDTTVEGMCYAIPINEASPIADELMKREIRELVDEKEMGYMGIVGVMISAQDSEKYNMPEGIYLQQIVEGSPAEKAGLRVGDILKKFDGISLSSYSSLQENMRYYAAGETVDIKIYRQDDGEYKEQTIKITLGKRME